MGRDGDGDGAVEEQILIIAFMGCGVFLGKVYYFMCFVLCFSSPPLC